MTVHEVGAVAGLVTVAGLAVHYISQARDVKRLREWAGGAPERSGPGAALTGHDGGAGSDGGDGARTARASRDDGPPDKPKRDATVTPGNVTVAVLNGTTVPGLAAALGDQLVAAGFKKGTIDVFSDQQRAGSVVQYAHGHQAEAQAVGRSVGIGQREPATADSRALAGDATVIVIAGADQAP